MARRPLSERFERSSWGQLLVSAVIVAVLLAEVGTHLPSSAIERRVSKTANEVIRIVASEQTWGVFAPNPRSTSLRLEGRVYFDDGSMETWVVPSGPRVVGNLRYYRWRKWLERVRDDGYTHMWEPTARWVASLYEDQPSPVVRVELVRFFRENAIEDPQPPFEEFTYYTLDLTEDGP